MALTRQGSPDLARRHAVAPAAPRTPGASTGTDVGGPRPGSRTWFLVPLAIFAASRVVSTVVLVVAGRSQVAPPGGAERFPASPTLADLLANWDGWWYRLIALEGYPATLPRVDGAVVQNTWAFFPVTPGTARLLMTAGLGHAAASTLVALVTSALACVVLHDMVRQRAGGFSAALAVAALCLGPVGVLFQTPYTEGPAILLVLLALRALGARRWGALAAAGVLLAFTRPITLPLAAVAGLAWIALWRDRERVPFPARDRVGLAAAGALIAVSTAFWPLVAALVTGEGDAYALTQQAWLYGRSGWGTWLSGLVGHGQLAAAVVGVPMLTLVAWAVLRRGASAWPREARAWALVYALYILAVSRPTTSILRYLVLTVFPLWPWPDVSARVRSPRARVAFAVPVLAAYVLAQWWWTTTIWIPHASSYYPP